MTPAPAQLGVEAHSHGGNADGWVAPVQTRSERPWSTDPAAFGPLTNRDPQWHFADLQRIAPLVIDEPADAGALTVTGAETVDTIDSAFRPEDVAAAVALKHATPRRITVDGTTHVEIVGHGGRALEHIVIDAPEGAKGFVVLRHTGSAQLLENVEISVAPNADVTLVSVQEWDDSAIHIAAHQASVATHGRLKHIVVSFGGGIVRVNPSVALEGEGAEGELLGLAYADSGQHLESQVFLHHVGRHTHGRVTYKAALQGSSARTVWVGDVLIGPEATATDSYEQNRNLVLTPGARADSIPNLEIETGEIQGAGHASATGRFDDEQMFYLQARGIPEEEARRLVVIGFLAEIIQKIGDAELEERLTAAVEAELAGGTR